MVGLDTKKEVAKETSVKEPMRSLAQPAGVRLSSMSRQTGKEVRVILAACLSNFQVVGEKIRSKEPTERPELLLGVHLSIMPIDRISHHSFASCDGRCSDPPLLNSCKLAAIQSFGKYRWVMGN